MEDPQGYYCSTSGTVFADKDALTDHYKSELHRYNLKRKVAGAPGTAVRPSVSLQYAAACVRQLARAIVASSVRQGSLKTAYADTSWQ